MSLVTQVAVKPHRKGKDAVLIFFGYQVLKFLVIPDASSRWGQDHKERVSVFKQWWLGLGTSYLSAAPSALGQERPSHCWERSAHAPWALHFACCVQRASCFWKKSSLFTRGALQAPGGLILNTADGRCGDAHPSLPQRCGSLKSLWPNFSRATPAPGEKCSHGASVSPHSFGPHMWKTKA